MARRAPLLLRWPSSLAGGWPVWLLTIVGLLGAAEAASRAGLHALALVLAQAAFGSLSLLALACFLTFVRGCWVIVRAPKP